MVIFLWIGYFFQHSTHEVRKLGAETSSVRFWVGSSDGLSLKMRWHFCFPGYKHIQVGECLLGQENMLLGQFREVMSCVVCAGSRYGGQDFGPKLSSETEERL